jgi:hypothetical protein
MMDYENLFSRAWDIVWKNKFLILLGVFIVLGGAGGGGSSQGQYTFSHNDLEWGEFPQIELGGSIQDWLPGPLVTGGIVVVLAALLLFAAAFWILGTLSRGGLIHGVNQIELGNSTNFSEALQAGWNKGWNLLGIGLVPAIPGIVLLAVGMVALVSLGGFRALTQGDFQFFEVGIFLPFIILGCLMIPVSLVLTLLRTFANRACVLAGHGVISAYRYGFDVLGQNLAPALLLFLIQIAIRIGIGMILLIPRFLMSLCCFLWPLIILIEAAFTTYYSTLWTLAWNEWERKPDIGIQ